MPATAARADAPGTAGLKPQGFSQRLRIETRDEHERVDAAFGSFDLADPADYGAFLLAHARVLPGLEQTLRPGELLPHWHPRADSLRADLAALALAAPEPLPIDLPSTTGARWGAVYVLEGSRLGGAVLARRTGAGLPRAYLLSGHAPGGWQDVTRRLDELSPRDRPDALMGARAAFALFARAGGASAPQRP